jgi:hypothetical protein
MINKCVWGRVDYDGSGGTMESVSWLKYGVTTRMGRGGVQGVIES